MFLGLTLGISQSFIILLPFTIFVYYFILSRIFKINSHLIGFLYGWVFGTGFFLGSMHWMVNPFLVYEKHFYLIPLGAFVFPVIMGLFFSIPFSLIVFTKEYIQFLKDKIFLKSFWKRFPKPLQCFQKPLQMKSKKTHLMWLLGTLATVVRT